MNNDGFSELVDAKFNRFVAIPHWIILSHYYCWCEVTQLVFHCNILLLHLPSMIPSISYQNRLQFKALLKLPGLKSTRQVYHLVEIFSNLRKTHGLNEILMMESNSNSDMIGLFLLVKVLLYMNSNWLNFTYSIQLTYFFKRKM